MEKTEYEALVSRLESTAKEKPAKYLASVILVALLGFAIIGVAIGFSLLAAALLVGIVALAIFSGGKALLFLGKLGKLVIVLAIPAWTMVKSSFTILFSRFPKPQGREIIRSEAPALFARLDDLRQRMGGPPIHKVLLTDELNAAIVQHPRFGLIGWEQNYLILGFPLLQVLGQEEALAVVAHEYGHLSGHHGRLAGFVYRFRAAWGRVQNMSEEWDDWGSRLMARMFRWYSPYFNAYTFVLARRHEYDADRSSVEVAGRQHAANALMRVDVMASFEDEIFWPAVDRRVAKEPDPPSSRTSFWQQSMDSQLDEAACTRFLQTACRRKTDHHDTHPSLSDRLHAIGAPLNSEALPPLEKPRILAANAWLGSSLPKIQAEFDSNWREEIAENWRSRHTYLQERLERLTQLEGQNSLETDEQWEHVCLVRELQPETDLLPLVNSLLDRAPDHLEALYRRGTLLLASGNEAGIDDLERVMKVDADSILACCDGAWRFYETREPEKADHYLKLWQERADHLRRVEEELRNLPADATLAPADLDEAALESLRQLLRKQGKNIRRAYVLRRVVKADATVMDYVLAFETSPFTLGDKGPTVIKSLLQEEFPVRMFVVHLGSAPYKRFKKSIKKLKTEPLIW